MLKGAADNIHSFLTPFCEQRLYSVLMLNIPVVIKGPVEHIANCDYRATHDWTGLCTRAY